MRMWHAGRKQTAAQPIHLPDRLFFKDLDMKRIVLSLAAVAALAVSGIFANTAQAHHPHHHGGYCGPRYSYGYGAYTGYSPYNVYRSPYVPYAAGYSGGWQPYRYNPQPRVGLYLGF